MEVLDDQGGAEDMIKWLEEPAVEAKSFVLGSPYTFHAAFNATVPAAPPTESMRFEDLYKITEADEKRAANVLANKGKIPNLMSNGASKSKKGSKSKKKKSKKKSR